MYIKIIYKMIRILDKDDIEGYDWDEWNIKKSEIRHNVHYKECEQVFARQPVISRDFKHSEKEERYSCIGMTNDNRILFISFTIRNDKIRIISGRPADRRERNFYEKIKKTT